MVDYKLAVKSFHFISEWAFMNRIRLKLVIVDLIVQGGQLLEFHSFAINCVVLPTQWRFYGNRPLRVGLLQL